MGTSIKFLFNVTQVDNVSARTRSGKRRLVILVFCVVHVWSGFLKYKSPCRLETELITTLGFRITIFVVVADTRFSVRREDKAVCRISEYFEQSQDF